MYSQYNKYHLNIPNLTSNISKNDKEKKQGDFFLENFKMKQKSNS